MFNFAVLTGAGAVILWIWIGRSLKVGGAGGASGIDSSSDDGRGKLTAGVRGE